MKKIMKIALGLAISAMMLFAFAGCGTSETPADQAAAALDKTLSALKSADMTAIQNVSGGEDVFGEAETAFGSEEATQQILKAMFGHFDYTIGTPEQVDDSNVNVPVTVSNADMNKAVETWFDDLMEYATSNPDITGDEEALQAKTIEFLETSVDKVAEGEDGIVSQDVVIPMVLTNGQWNISDTVDGGVIDAILGGFVSAIENLSNSTQ
ncbi:MAG: hypothetical protein ACSW8G_06110 [Bacillota bacterium]